MCIATRLHDNAHPDLVAAVFRGGNQPEILVGLVNDETQVLQCGDDRIQHLLLVGHVERAGLKTAQLDRAGAFHDMLVRRNAAAQHEQQRCEQQIIPRTHIWFASRNTAFDSLSKNAW